jgi:hypothetical protein
MEVSEIDLYFESDTYQQLIDENTGLYKKTWMDIYNILKQELS